MILIKRINKTYKICDILNFLKELGFKENENTNHFATYVYKNYNLVYNFEDISLYKGVVMLFESTIYTGTLLEEDYKEFEEIIKSYFQKEIRQIKIRNLLNK